MKHAHGLWPGERFGMLTVVGPSDRRVSSRPGSVWHCRCDCGGEIHARRENLTRGYRKTCGCATQLLKHRTHGKSTTPTYTVWQMMLRRCTRPTKRERPSYQGRGIAVCDRWRRFENFLADMGERPAGRTLDRWPDNDGNYEPGNCRWATPKQQLRNTRRNRLVTFDGMTMCVAEWAERIGINEMTLWKRLAAGWSPEKAITQPVLARGAA